MIRYPGAMQQPPFPDMVWIPGGTFLMGFGSALCGGAAVAPGNRRWFLDGSIPGHQPTLRALHRGERTHDLRRDSTGSSRLSRCPAGHAVCRLARVLEARRPCGPPADHELVAFHPRCAVASSVRAGEHAGRTGSSSGRSRHLRRRRGVCAGRANRCRPRPNGNSRRVAASMGLLTHGERNSSPAGSTWPTPGRVPFPGKTRWTMVSSGPRRSGPLRRTATTCTT